MTAQFFNFCLRSVEKKRRDTSHNALIAASRPTSLGSEYRYALHYVLADSPSSPKISCEPPRGDVFAQLNEIIITCLFIDFHFRLCGTSAGGTCHQVLEGSLGLDGHEFLLELE